MAELKYISFAKEKELKVRQERSGKVMQMRGSWKLGGKEVEKLCKWEGVES